MFETRNEIRKRTFNELKKTKVFIVGRFDAPTDYLADFLKERTQNLYLFKISPQEQGSTPLISATKFKRRKIVRKRTVPRFFKKISNPFLFALFTLITYAYVSLLVFVAFLRHRDFDIVVGVGPFNGWVSTLYKIINKEVKTVFYCEDKVFVKKGIVTKLIFWCDQKAKEKSSAVWFVSDTHMNYYRDKWLRRKSVYVPEPVITKGNKARRNKNIVFIGGLSKYQGMDLLYKVFKKISERYHGVRLVLIGSGDMEKKMKRWAKLDGLSQRIEFKGFVVGRDRILSLISNSYLGVAFYNPSIYKNLQYGHSSKISNYIGCGLPVITTGKGRNTPSLAKYIKKFKLGFVLDYDEDLVYKSIDKLLKDKKIYKAYRKNTEKFAQIFDRDRIYSRALGKLFWGES